MTTRGPGGVEHNRWQHGGGRVLSVLVRPTAPPIWLGLLVAAAAISAETLLMSVLKHFAPMDNFGLVYLLGALVAAIGWGSGLAAVTSPLSALAFGYFHDWPNDAFHPTDLRKLGVEALGGHLWVNSPAGVGTSLGASIPCAGPQADAFTLEAADSGIGS